EGQSAPDLLKLIEEQEATRTLDGPEVYELYQRADALLQGSDDAEALARLRDCALIVMRMLSEPDIRSEGFNLYDAVHDFEARLIERALEEAHGSVTKAARILGLTHQTLGTILNTRHKSLASKRTPVRKRLRSIFKKPDAEARH
ncbi:MAG TPA: helix-turn-helix domain-containing protein, partial [Pyrinomonadaceae bacterium]